MIDIHTHFIYGVDDGYKDIEHSIKDLKEEEQIGVTDVICTPHFRKGMFETHFETIKKHFNVLKEFAGKENININLYLGSEIYCKKMSDVQEVFQLLDNKELSTMNNTKYLLLEFPYYHDVDISEIVYTTLLHKYIPIIAHIERYTYLDYDKICNLKEMGALIQTNASAVIGKDGIKTKKLIAKLINNQVIDFIASDIHSSRINYMLQAYNLVLKKNGEKTANLVFNKKAKEFLL